MEKLLAVGNFCAILPPHQDCIQLFMPPPPPPPILKSGNCLCCPFNMAKTSRYCVKKTPKHFEPPTSAWQKHFLRPLFIGVKLHVSPSPSCFVALLPVISDQSLKA